MSDHDSNDLPEDVPGLRTELRHMRRDVLAHLERIERSIDAAHTNASRLDERLRVFEVQLAIAGTRQQTINKILGALGFAAIAVAVKALFGEG